MKRFLRNRTLSLLIAILAIITNALSPEVFSQVQASVMPGMEMCHAPAGPNAGDKHVMKGGHACCKVCVCHPAAAAITGGAYLPPLPPAESGGVSTLASGVAAHDVFSTKSSPRGPPARI